MFELIDVIDKINSKTRILKTFSKDEWEEIYRRIEDDMEKTYLEYPIKNSESIINTKYN
jgi:hypothetical protein